MCVGGEYKKNTDVNSSGHKMINWYQVIFIAEYSGRQTGYTLDNRGRGGAGNGFPILRCRRKLKTR